MNVKNAMIASAVASMFLAAGARAEGSKGKSDKTTASAVHCAGINGCKGQGSCAGADNSCKSKNDCKGKGWSETDSAKACTDKGGTVVVAKK